MKSIFITFYTNLSEQITINLDDIYLTKDKLGFYICLNKTKDLLSINQPTYEKILEILKKDTIYYSIT